MHITLLHHCTMVLHGGGAREWDAAEAGNGDLGFVEQRPPGLGLGLLLSTSVPTLLRKITLHREYTEKQS